MILITLWSKFVPVFWRCFSVVSGVGAVLVWMILMSSHVRAIGTSPPPPDDSGYGSVSYYCEAWYSVGLTPDNLEWLANALGVASGPVSTLTYGESQSLKRDCGALMAPGLEQGQAEEMCTMMGEQMYGSYENCMADYGY